MQKSACCMLQAAKLLAHTNVILMNLRNILHSRTLFGSNRSESESKSKRMRLTSQRKKNTSMFSTVKFMLEFHFCSSCVDTFWYKHSFLNRRCNHIMFYVIFYSIYVYLWLLCDCLSHFKSFYILHAINP